MMVCTRFDLYILSFTIQIFCTSITEEQILAEQLLVASLPLATTMTLPLTNMVCILSSLIFKYGVYKFWNDVTLRDQGFLDFNHKTLLFEIEISIQNTREILPVVSIFGLFRRELWSLLHFYDGNALSARITEGTKMGTSERFA